VLIGNNEYPLLQDLFSICFKTDIRRYNSITQFKRESYPIVQTYTYRYFQINLKGFYDANNVYQMGYDIYDNTSDVHLGQFKESYRLEEIFHNGATYSFYPDNIYYRNRCLFHKLDEASAIELSVIIGDSSDGNVVLLNDRTMKLLDKYKLAVSLLKNGNINQYVDIDYVYNYFI